VHPQRLRGPGATGAVAGGACAAGYARFSKLPLARTADALSVPLALGLAFEQLGALLAGSGYGIAAGSSIRWAVTYSSPLARLWSGTPLYVPLHPVQAYVSIAYLVIALALFFWQAKAHRPGDLAGLWLMATGVAVYMTEFWRDPEGRGSILRGALDWPQMAAVAMVLAGAWLLRERKLPQGAHAANLQADETRP